MWRSACLLLVFTATAVSAMTDPCSHDGHKELDDRRRSTGYILQSQEKPLCDMTLQSGWYRFTSGAGGTLPEHCPGRFQCGTIVPVWMNGAHPSVDEGVVSRTACANFNSGSSDTSNCCEHHLFIGVKNCGNFFVYYLKPTASCYIAYCAGDKSSCPLGTWSPTGFPPCKKAFPNVTADPVLSGPEVFAHSFRFSCSIDLAEHDPDIAFDVEWLFDGKPDPNMPATTIRDPSRVAYLPGTMLRGHMDTNVGCRIRARYLSNGNMSSPWLLSNTYWAGIRAEPNHVTISEKTELKNVTLVSTVPIVCDHSSLCCITMKVDVDGPRENMVTSHSCEYQMCSTDWNDTLHTASIKIPISASKDQVKDGNKHLLLAFENILSSGGGPFLQAFDGYSPMNVPVVVQDAPTKSCVWFGDPHIHGMESDRTFHLFDVGDFTMIENPSRHMEVQARTWPCNGRVACVCGLTIREKDDVIRINECDQPHVTHRRSPTVEVASPLREGTVIHRSTDGNQITVYFPSGMEVLVENFRSGLNVHLEIPSSDEGHARGVCGTFDSMKNNEFTRRDGGVEHACHANTPCIPKRFTNSWKNERHDSLFEILPPHTNDDSVPKYCSCDIGNTQRSRINCTALGDIPRHTLKCRNCSPLDDPIPSFLDAGQGWSRRSAVYEDRDEPDPKFDMQQYQNFHVGSASWPTPSGITHAHADYICQQQLQQSQLWSHCHDKNAMVTSIIEDCVTDVLYGDNFDMVEAAVASFTTECQTNLGKDPHNYVTNAHGKSVLKPEVSDDVCSVFCLRNGHCERGKCICKTGYTGKNCHLIVRKGPQLERIRNGNTCDLNKKPCRKIFLDASNLDNGHSLSCAVHSVHENGTLSKQLYQKRAQYLTANRLACFLPDNHGNSVTTFSVKATNNRHVFGNSLLITIFDSTCQACHQNGTCTQLASTCLIKNTCHQDGDINPQDRTLFCNASANSTDWSSKPGNYPDVSSVSLAGPDNDYQMLCIVNSSATEASARFQVTWYIDNIPRSTEVVKAPHNVAFFNMLQLQAPGEMDCKVTSYFEGSNEFSPFIASNTTKRVDVVGDN